MGAVAAGGAGQRACMRASLTKKTLPSLQATPLSTHTVLKLSKELPVVVEYNIESIGRLAFFLAPKVRRLPQLERSGRQNDFTLSSSGSRRLRMMRQWPIVE